MAPSAGAASVAGSWSAHRGPAAGWRAPPSQLASPLHPARKASRAAKPFKPPALFEPQEPPAEYEWFDRDLATELAAAAAGTSAPGQHLAVVIPVCFSCGSGAHQLAKTLALWAEFPPCSAATDRAVPLTDDDVTDRDDAVACASGESSLAPGARGASTAARLVSAHLIIYGNVRRPQKEESARAWARDARVDRCFQNVSYANARLAPAENGYPQGPNRMFYKLALHLLRLRRFHYFFQVEPDVVPLRRLWLEHLALLVPPHAAGFWVKGSAPRAKAGHQELHLNGNALYNARDPRFAQFLAAMAGAYRKTPFAYDTAMWKALSGASTMFRNEHWHLFVFSDFIINYYSLVAWSEARRSFPCALFLHANKTLGLYRLDKGVPVMAIWR
jgi:hypothetical protein